MREISKILDKNVEPTKVEAVITPTTPTESSVDQTVKLEVITSSEQEKEELVTVFDQKLTDSIKKRTGSLDFKTKYLDRTEEKVNVVYHFSIILASAQSFDIHKIIEKVLMIVDNDVNL